MLDTPEIDLESFLGQGAVFGDRNSLYVFWGEPEESSKRPPGPGISQWDFFQDEVKWESYPNFTEISYQDAGEIFNGPIQPIHWIEASASEFKSQFQMIDQWFEKGELSKVVPYVFENSNQRISSKQLNGILNESLKHQSGYLYGRWNKNSGMLGVTPEVLIQQKSYQIFQSMALAGTCSLEQYNENSAVFLTDEKEIFEHEKVVQFFRESLAEFGSLNIGEREVKSAHNLVHFHTSIALSTDKEIPIDHLAQALHPTPALGCYPQKNWRDYLGAFDRIEPRGSFGAPFGVSLSSEKALYLVAIRNLQWNSQGSRIGSGCGVVPLSQMDREWEELKRKRNSVKSLLGGL